MANRKILIVDGRLCSVEAGPIESFFKQNINNMIPKNAPKCMNIINVSSNYKHYSKTIAE